MSWARLFWRLLARSGVARILMFLCLCRGIRDWEFNNLVTRHGTCPIAVARAMGLDENCCGRCEANMEEMIRNRCRVPQFASRDRTERTSGDR